MAKVFSPKNLPELQLPLMNLKGNDYMKVAHRLLWFVNDQKNYTIQTEFAHLSDTRATAKVTVSIFDDKGNLCRQAVAHKSETQKDFADFTEKAETGALGRALASLGYGTAQAISDLEEGNRIVDAPLETPAAAPKMNVIVAPTKPEPITVSGTATTSFSSKKKGSSAPNNVVPISPTAAAPAYSADDDWS